MAANVTNSQTLRDYLVTLFNTNMRGAGKPLSSDDTISDVLNHYEDKIAPRREVVMVCDAGDDATMTKLDGAVVDTWFYFEVWAWVIYADDTATPAWTPTLAENKRSLIRKYIKDIVIDHRGKSQDANAPWNLLTFNGKSAVGDVQDDGGTPYLVEITFLKARLSNG